MVTLASSSLTRGTLRLLGVWCRTEVSTGQAPNHEARIPDLITGEGWSG